MTVVLVSGLALRADPRTKTKSYIHFLGPRLRLELRSDYEPGPGNEYLSFPIFFLMKENYIIIIIFLLGSLVKEKLMAAKDRKIDNDNVHDLGIISIFFKSWPSIIYRAKTKKREI